MKSPIAAIDQIRRSAASPRVLVRPSHVALLVPSVERSARFLSQYGFEIGPAENWEGEGTKEIYIEKDKGNSLLLMEPVQPGAYQRAMEKRGPGLHHLAIDVLNLQEFLLSIASSGWLLHPISVRTMAEVRTAYLARPGFPALIEVQERQTLQDSTPFVTGIEISIPGELRHLISVIGLEEIVQPLKGQPTISFGSATIILSDLINPEMD